MGDAQKILGLVERGRRMDYHVMTAWDVIKKFLAGWAAALGILVVISCVKYWDFITTAFVNNTWALFNAVMPIVIIVFVLFYMLRSIFR